MKDRKELLEKLEDLRKKICVNSKDAHFAEKMIDEMLSIKGQLSIRPTELNVGKKLEEWGSETFSITKTDRGVLYNEYSHFAIFVDPQYSLYSLLSDIVDSKEEVEAYDAEAKEQYELEISAIAYCLSIPKLIASDAEFMFKVATMVINYLQEKQEEILNAELQDETPVENAEFEQVAIAMSELQKE